MLVGAQHLQNIHPLIVHFPIAYLVGAALFYLLAWVFRKDSFATAAFWMLVLGFGGILLAAASGLYAEPGVMVARSVREHLLLPHKKFMITTGILTLLVTIWAVIDRPFPKKMRAGFMILFLFLLLALTLGGDLGARLVYDYNAGGYACSQPIEFTK